MRKERIPKKARRTQPLMSPSFPSPLVENAGISRGSAPFFWKVLVSVGLLGAIFLCYGQLCGSDVEFLRLDDGDYVESNEHVQAGLTPKSIAWSFTTFAAMNWHPLTWLSLQVDYEIYGLSPGGYHLTNVILHALNSVLLLVVLTRMTRTFWPSAIVTAFFALHPLRVESVAWIAERKDVLSTLFWILTMLTYVRYVEVPSVGRYALVLMSFILGLLAKPMLVTLPFALLLLDYWPLQRLRLSPTHQKDAFSTGSASWAWLLLEKAPLFVLSIATCVVTIIAQEATQERVFANLPFSMRVLNALLAFIRYVVKTLWPSDLAPMYSQTMDFFPLGQSIVAALVFMLITLLCLVMVRRRPYLAVGWFWFVGTLVPVIGLVQVGVQSMADRYSYVPHIGLFIMLVWGIRDLLARISSSLIGCITGTLVLACLVLTYQQAQLWKNNLTLWEHALKVTTDNYAAYDEYGVALAAKGNTSEAIAQFRRAIQLEPDNFQAQHHLARALIEQQKWAEAVESFKTVINLAPKMPEAYDGLGQCYLNLNMMEEALAPFAELVKLAPQQPVFHANYGMTLLSRGKLAEAEVELLEALRLDPQQTDAKKLLGCVFALQGRFAQAEEQLRSALQPQKPNQRLDAAAAFYLGWVLQAEGKTDAAHQQYQKAMQLAPRWPREMQDEAWRMATNPEAIRRNGSLALLLAEVVNQSGPKTEDSVLEVVAAALAEVGRFPEAASIERKAVELATTSGSQKQVEAMRQRLRMYEQGQPYREEPKSGK